MSQETTAPQRRWALEKWYIETERKPTLEQLNDIVNMMALDEETSGRELDQLRYAPNADAENVFDTLASIVAKQPELFSDFAYAVKSLISADHFHLLNGWQSRSKEACRTTSPALLPDEREVLNANTVPDQTIITCPKCQDIMNRPVILRCLHSCCSACAVKAGDLCPVCRLKYREKPAANIAITRHMKYLALKIASEKCQKCEKTSASAMGAEKTSEFCEQCKAFFCSKHVCDNRAHRKVATEEYLKSNKMELYNLTCEAHDCDMTYSCQHCNSFHCAEYTIFYGGEHAVQSFCELAPNAQKVIKGYLDDNGRHKAVLVDHQPENLCNELLNFYEGILKTNKDLAVTATEAAFNEAKPDIIGYCSSLEEHSKTLRSWIDQADMYLEFLVSSKAEWIAEQWSVISQQLHLLMRETGFVHSDAFQRILADGRLQSSFQSDSATDIKFARLQVDYVDPSSKESTAFAFIKELVGVPTKKDADTPAHLRDILLAIKESSNSLRYQKKEVDVVSTLRLELEEKDSTILQLKGEIDSLRSQLESRCARLTSSVLTMAGTHDVSDRIGFKVLHSESTTVALLSSPVNSDDRRSTGVPLETVLGNLKSVSEKIVEKLTKEEADKIARSFASKSWLLEEEKESVLSEPRATYAAQTIVNFVLKKTDNSEMIKEFVVILEKFNKKDLVNELKGVQK